MQCFYNFKEDTSENQIIILKPNYEFLIWKLELSQYVVCVSPFQLFKRHYLKATYNLRKISNKSSRLKKEMSKAWNCADIEVHLKYIKLASLHNSFSMDLHLNLSFNFFNNTFDHEFPINILNLEKFFFLRNTLKNISKNSLSQSYSLTWKKTAFNSKKTGIIIALRKKSGLAINYIRIYYEE
ncbi:hypothetical protein RhiirC2_841372 [Rhizophagus irregularis]|uniref:Uncharacterized protein n=1 Tax=Rhizophagus irregularis TaxID=588596 RepID=A0A2N1P3V4_9GLOM|nr:hypothetical protein RhiirC2_841372 [Rhizophagus irregularis]